MEGRLINREQDLLLEVGSSNATCAFTMNTSVTDR
jgi:hypothetical protein